MLAGLRSLPRTVRWGVPALLVAGLAWFVALPLAFEPLLRWGLVQATASWAGHRLEFTSARWTPWRLAAEVQGLALRGPQGDELAAVERLEIDLAASSLPRRAWILDALTLDAPRLLLALDAQGRSNWDALRGALAPAEPGAAADAQAEPPRLRIEALRIARGRLAWLDRRGGGERRSALDAIDLALDALSTLPQDRGTHLLAARTTLGGTLRWQGRFGLAPLQAEGRVEIEGLQLARLWALLPTPPLAIAPPAGEARATLAYRVDEAAWRLDDLRVQLDGVALQGAGDAQAATPALAFDRVVLEGGRVDGARRELAASALRWSGGRVQAVRDGQGRLDLLDWLPPATPSTPPAPPASPPAPWTLQLDRLAVERVALAFEDRSLAEPLAVRSAAAALEFGLAATVGAPTPLLTLRDLTLQLDDIDVASGGAAPWLVLPSLQLEGGAFDLAARRAEASQLRLRGGQLAVARDRDGALALARAFVPRTAAASTKTSATDPAWQARLGALHLDGWSAAFTDASVAPPARFALGGLEAEARELGTDLRRPVALRAAARVASGGRLALQGRLTPAAGAAATPRAELQLRVDGLALAPLQPYLEPLTVLRVAAGEARAAGRLQWQGPAWAYEGGAGLSGLRVDAPGRDTPFLQLAALDAPRLALTPARLDLGRVQLDGLAAELIIDRDRRINLAALGRSAAAPAGSASAPAPAPVAAAPAAAAAPASAPAAPAPRLVLERLRLVDAQLDFADLSLALPFAARIQRLNGEIAGLDSGAGAPPAALELEGQVAPNGLARARGSLQPLAPTAFSDVQVSFRNIEMTTLTPYTATFAGRRIASGKLSLDLDYKLRERQLQGDNRIVMERLTLGERVDSPDATSLPLDLAIALLEDSDGRIDLGLPVSGSLDDPQFSYRSLVWKAIVNVLTKIVTAPFRALGALFGGNDALADGIGRIAFDPGRAALLPPEREKLQRLATALAKRPGLAVQLPAAATAAAVDREALRALQLRRALAALEGRALGPDGDPGPLALQLPGTQAALEQRFVQRFGAPALAQLKAPSSAPSSAPSNAPSAAPSKAPPAASSPAGPPRLPELLWQRLLEAEVVDEAGIGALGEARRAALAEALRAAGLDAARIQSAPAGVVDARDSQVIVRLELGAAAAAR